MSSPHSGDAADFTPHTAQHLQNRRWAVALLLVSSALAACSDSNPTAPDASVELTEQAHSQVATSLVPVVDDAAERLLLGEPTESPLRSALETLRSALAAQKVDAALRAVTDAQLALEFSRAAQSMDAADRDALVLQLGVVHAQLAAEAR